MDAVEAAASSAQSESWRKTRGLLEFPEDLGRAALGDAASIWQYTKLRNVAGMTRGAIFQCQWSNADYSKPTGLLTSIPEFFDDLPSYVGWPVLSEDFQYNGPLPPKCPHSHPPLAGRDAAGNWRTGYTGSYPDDMCKHFAVRIFTDFTKRMSAQVTMQEEGGPSWLDFPIFPICDDAGHLCAYAKEIKLPTSGRDYVRGASTKLGLRKSGSKRIIDMGVDIGTTILPTSGVEECT